jgi:hypothetical protein
MCGHCVMVRVSTVACMHKQNSVLSARVSATLRSIDSVRMFSLLSYCRCWFPVYSNTICQLQLSHNEMA